VSIAVRTPQHSKLEDFVWVYVKLSVFHVSVRTNPLKMYPIARKGQVNMIKEVGHGEHFGLLAFIIPFCLAGQQ